MLLKAILLFFIIVASNDFRMIKSEHVHSQGNLSCQNPRGSLFEDVAINPFIDDNRYIRLNITWDRPKANFSNFEMMIDTNCSALYGDRNISVDQGYAIQPSLERLMHPAEPLQHGCNYDFEFFAEISTDNRTCVISQNVNYLIPECVEQVCQCEVADVPYKFVDYQSTNDKFYIIRFKKTDTLCDLELEEVFDKVWYTNIASNKTMSLVQPEHIRFDNFDPSLKLPVHDFQPGNSYIIYVDLLKDNCPYRFTLKMDVPQNGIIAQSYLNYLTVAIGLCLTIVVLAYLLLRIKPELMDKLRTYFPFIPGVSEVYSVEPSVVTFTTKKEVINSQYTPLEFLVNSHKFDKFEIPRNKIAIKNEIGGGAFGKVFLADVYELDQKSGCVRVAVKMAVDNAPNEEVADFLSEIETMKKIASCGGHANVIRLLACVTIDVPYMMVMELVPCGSLKSYLTNLRIEWERRKDRLKRGLGDRRFFPDNMVVEHYLPTVSITESSNEPDKLKYSDLAFSDYTGSTGSIETNSYINPETPRTPSSPGSPIESVSTGELVVDYRGAKFERNRPKSRIGPVSLAPKSPDSLSSSDLPSASETLLTPLESNPVTPLIDLTDNCYEKLKPVLDSKELQSFALQIANGMAFLEKNNITHRDLAARNVLVSADKLLKISDFGMARHGVYVNTANKRQPLRWMAPEAIESRRCDNKTDVWSFGVLLWEIGSLGAFPYKKLSNEQVIAYIMQGNRLERPETCTDQVYDLMRNCWHQNPELRPTFEEIAKKLDENNGKIYVDFSKISPKYVFPPIQEGGGT